MPYFSTDNAHSKLMYTAVYHACSFVMNLDLFCIDNTRIMYRKIRYIKVQQTCCLTIVKERNRFNFYHKGKAIPLQAWTGPEGSRRLGCQTSKTISTWRWQGCQTHLPAAFTPQEIFLVFVSVGARNGIVVKALCYKPAGHGFDSQWYHWNFSVT